ncbi:acyl carrier protein [Phytohabitans aurantiacus]|uniref:Carrier domain-containing protein n=1 Tax=Phytohabitans aurantiacus TaxID=3016789 RepID=A0ABQ5QRV1_9ACTN|nr:acyl carrier protein [Phytohabitans aurantiacus]GLH96045.1 hypothetical protein Pa4123_13180 [Phytohabitans aurantiacus]
MREMTDEIARIMVDVFGVPPGRVGAATAFTELEADSLTLAELTLLLEQRYGVPVADGDLRPEHTVSDVAALLRDKGAAGGR